jgi:hypothetical protein
MKRTIILTLTLIFIFTVSGLNAQSADSTTQEESVLPPTSKSRKSDAATRYSTPPKSKSDWRKKIYVGGYFGMSFGSSYTNIDISPIVGYRITDDFSMGLGVIYTYYSYEVPNFNFGTQKYSFSNWGARVNANYVLFKFIALGAEYQYITTDIFDGYDVSNSATFRKEGINILFVGGGISQRVGGNASVYVMAYYDLLQDKYSPYGNNIVWRIGVSAGF